MSRRRASIHEDYIRLSIPYFLQRNQRVSEQPGTEVRDVLQEQLVAPFAFVAKKNHPASVPIDSLTGLLR